MKQDKIRKPMTTGGFRALGELNEQEVTGCIISIFDGYEKRREPANFDRLLSMGITTAKSGIKGAANVVLQWLGAGASSKKVDIACAFLTGLWDRAYRREPVSKEHFEGLIRHSELAAHDEDTLYSFVQALRQGAGSAADDSARHLIFGALKDIDSHKYPGVIGNMIRDLIADTLP